MAASNRHRKLMETNSTFEFPSCILECDTQLNLTGICSAKCIFYCPSFCRTAESAPPPSSASPAASPYALPSPPDHHHHRYPHPLSLPLKISLIFIISTFIYTIYKFYTVWRRRRTPPLTSPETLETHDHDHIDMVDHPIWYIRTTGLQPSVINAITVTKFNKADRVIDGTDCSVCLSEFEEDDTLRLLPNCKHAFHISCIDTWLRSHTNCPLCRAGIVNNAADVPSQELTTVDLGFSSFGDFNRGEAGESSEMRIGETDEEYQIGSSDVAASDHDRIGSVDGDLGIELVKSGQTTDNNFSKREG